MDHAAQIYTKTADIVAGKGTPKKESLRRCVVSGKSLPSSSLIRFVSTPDNIIIPDIKGKLPGRGIWIKSDAKAISQAIENKAFSRSAKCKVSIFPDLVDHTEIMLRKYCLSLISLAKSAGQLVNGFEKVKILLKNKKADLYIIASDCAQDSRNKLINIDNTLPVIDLFDSNELAKTIGCEHVMHIALKKDGLSNQILVQSARLKGLAIETDAT